MENNDTTDNPGPSRKGIGSAPRLSFAVWQYHLTPIPHFVLDSNLFSDSLSPSLKGRGKGRGIEVRSSRRKIERETRRGKGIGVRFSQMEAIG
jgi:hypothetical protein